MRAVLLAALFVGSLIGTANALPMAQPLTSETNIVKVACDREEFYCPAGMTRTCPGPDFPGRADCHCVPCGYYRQQYAPRYQPQYAPRYEPRYYPPPPPPPYNRRRDYYYY